MQRGSSRFATAAAAAAAAAAAVAVTLFIVLSYIVGCLSWRAQGPKAVRR